ncbi:MAG: hypothetical protein ACRECA_12045 [Pseudolabrys sp.]
MKKTILSLLTAGAVGIAGLTAAPQPAHAVVWWVIPAIVGGAVLGVGAGAGAAIDNASHQQYAYEPHGNVYVEPSGCRIEQQRINGELRRVRVCG